ncbi:MAG: hypothetical protein OXG74_11760 [Acidobacteria bacterium]|nr:hypothetical protein [Acidobacteriota bacterium]
MSAPPSSAHVEVARNAGFADRGDKLQAEFAAMGARMTRRLVGVGAVLLASQAVSVFVLVRLLG